MIREHQLEVRQHKSSVASTTSYSLSFLQRRHYKLFSTLRKLRRKDDINCEVSVVRDIRERELRLYTDAGRVCRPLFIVENQQLLIQKKHIESLVRAKDDPTITYNWDSLLKDGVIELLDAEEEETA